MIGDFNSRPANENAGPCLRFHLSFLRFRLFGRPPSMPLEPIPEPFGSRWSLSGHIRYIRLGTRATVTLESATRSNLLVQEFSGSWRTPQGTIPRATLWTALLRSESLIECHFHFGHSTPEPLDVKAACVVS